MSNRAIILQSWKTGLWSVRSGDHIIVYEQTFETELDALKFAKERGYEWVDLPTTWTAPIGIDRAIKSHSADENLN